VVGNRSVWFGLSTVAGGLCETAPVLGVSSTTISEGLGGRRSVVGASYRAHNGMKIMRRNRMVAGMVLSLLVCGAAVAADEQVSSVADFPQSSSDGALIESDPVSTGGGPDMTFCQLYGLDQFGSTGDIVGLSLATTSWNVGTADLLWFRRPDAEHPFIVMNLYRLMGGKFEQVGQSWIKHGFFALSNTQCGGSCTFEQGHRGGDWLGMGCTDTYGASLNASQGGLGPRYEVNPWSGHWQHRGSMFDLGGPSNNGIRRRLQVYNDDLDPTMNEGAEYFGEGYYVCLDDVNVMNSASWKPVTPRGSRGNWSFDMSGRNTRPEDGFAIDAWTTAEQTLLAQEVPVVEFVSPDGRCVLAAEATDLGGGR